MKTTNTFGIHFIIRLPRHEKSGDALVYARVTVNGKRAEISLKQKIDPKFWDENKSRAKGKRDEAIKLNAHLERVRTLIAEGYNNLVQQRKIVTADSVKLQFTGEEEEIVTLKKLVAYHNEEFKGKLASGTMKNYHTTQRYIDKFLKEKCKRNDIALMELNYKFLIDFESYLRNYKPMDHRKPLKNNAY